MPKTFHSYRCDETGETGEAYCSPAREAVKHPNVRVAVTCRWPGCICKMAGTRWRRLTDEEEREYAERSEQRMVDALDRALRRSNRDLD